MAHDHDHANSESYYLDQLCSIGVCGAIGLVMCLLWYGDGLNYLSPKLRLPVLLGGICLLVLTAIRGIAVWLTVGKTKAATGHHHDHDHHHGGHDHHHGGGHDHHHEHGPGCDHSHDPEHAIVGEDPAHGHIHAAPTLPVLAAPEHSHEHATHFDHGHDHGWAPWRYVVLMLPVVLFLLNIPPRSAGEEETTDADNLPYMSFSTVERAAGDAQSRRDYEGKKGHLKGVLGRNSQGFLTLVRYKIVCCAADATPVNVLILPPDGDNWDNLLGQWVDITGEVGFMETTSSSAKYISTMHGEKIRKLDKPDPRQFIF